MPNFKIIEDLNEIHDWIDSTKYKDWIDSAKFNSKDKVDENGKVVGTDYEGHYYRVISKKERNFTDLERFSRGFLATLIVVCSVGLALFSKSVRNLFTKKKESIRFGILDHDTRFKIVDGKIIYIKPQTLFDGLLLTPKYQYDHIEMLTFALIQKDGQQSLVPVIGDTFAQQGKDFKIYEGSPLEALLKIAQDKEIKNCIYNFAHIPGSPIGWFLRHANNTLITEDEFFKFISEKDDSGTPRICTLNRNSTLDVLEMIKEKKLAINLNEKTPQGETLYSLWSGEGNTEITNLLLELDPSVIPS